MKTTIIGSLLLVNLLLLSFSTKNSLTSKDVLTQTEKCDCKTTYFSQSGYGKLKKHTRTLKNTTRKSCLKKHKQITKFSGRSETQIPYSTFCGVVIIKG